MRILDVDHDKPLDEVGVYLTIDEARELRDALEQLIKAPETHHCHINDSELKREITVSIYAPGKLDGFDERSRRIILSND